MPVPTGFRDACADKLSRSIWQSSTRISEGK
jgi:hypothetical protein